MTGPSHSLVGASIQPFLIWEGEYCLARRRIHYSLIRHSLVSRIQMGLPIQITAHELMVSPIRRAPPVRVHLTLHPKTHAATTAAGLASRHPDYTVLASRLCVADIHKSTEKSLSTWVTTYGKYRAALFQMPAHWITETKAQLDPDFVSVVEEHGYALENVIVHSRDFDLN